MNYPIVEIKTPDGLILYGLLTTQEKQTENVFLFIHGTASNFYCEDFIKAVTGKLVNQNIAVLSVNNRGAGIGETWQNSGAAVEHFEDCVIDIDAWIKYALDTGYKNVFLAGHSLGSEKVVYYMNEGTLTMHVKSVMLLGFADSYGYHYSKLNDKAEELMTEAHELVRNNKAQQYLTSTWLAHANALPQSAESYINFFSPNSELSKAFPIRQGKDLTYYQRIKVPIFAAISDGKEFTVIPTDAAIKLLQSENPNAKVYKINNCEHSFQGKESELADLLGKFIEKHI